MCNDAFELTYFLTLSFIQMTSESNKIPVINIVHPEDEQPQGDHQMELDDQINAYEQELEAEQQNMEALCNQIKLVGLAGNVVPTYCPNQHQHQN